MVPSMAALEEGLPVGDIRSVVIVSAVDPYPAVAGKSVVLAGFVEYWRRRVGAENVHYLLVHGSPPAAEKFPVPVHHLPLPRPRERVAALLTRVLTGRSSIQEALFYGRSLRRRLAQHLDALAPDLVLFDTVRLGQYVPVRGPAHPSRRVIYLDDLLSRRYRAMLDAGREHPDVTFDPLGAFAYLVPRPLRRLARNRRAQRAVLTVESRLIARSERAAPSRFDACLLVSQDEADALAAATGQDNVHAAPPLLQIRTGGERAWDGRPVFVCLGHLVLPHNDDGVRWFLSNAMPEVQRGMPAAEIRIIGRGARPELVDLAARWPQVSLTGYVPDLDGELARAAVLLAPMRFGSGIKIKLLDALARGLPVLTTSVGAHGIADGPEHGVVVEDRIDAWPAALASMCEPGRNAELSSLARARFRSTFSPEAVIAAYDRVFGWPAARPTGPGGRGRPRSR